VPSAECDAIFPNQFPAVLTVTLHDGRVLVEKVLQNRGGPGNPLSPEELVTKFTTNAGRRLPTTHARRLAEAILSLEDRPVHETLALTGPAGDARA
jgi:2-methylcitrate dehydratase PrpD